MTTSTAIPDWMLQHPNLQWIFPSIVLLVLICIVVVAIINIKYIKPNRSIRCQLI